MSFGPMEIGIIFLIVLLLFGAKRIPEIARGLGKGIREFKSATSEIQRELTIDEPRSQYKPPAQQSVNYAPPPKQQSAPQAAEKTESPQ